MNRTNCLPFLALMVLACLQNLAYASPQDDVKYRNWESANGKFSIEAKLLSSSNDSVKLKSRKGKVLDVEVSKLCDADRSYLRELSRAKKKDESKPSPKAKITARKDKSAIGKIPITVSLSFRKKAPRLKVVKYKATIASAAKLNFSFDQIGSDGPPISRSDQGENWLDSWTLSIDEKFLVTKVSSSSRKSWAFLYDLSEGTVSDPLLLPWDETKILSVSADGKLILTSGKPRANAARIDLWSIEDGKLKHVEGMRPASNSPRANTSLRDSTFDSAFLIEDQRVLSGTAPLLWDTRSGFDSYRREGKVIYQNDQIVLSPDREHYAVSFANRIHIFNIEGSLKGALALGDKEPEGKQEYSAIAFSPSGEFVAAKHGDYLTIWELEKGKVVDGFPVTESGCLAWVDDQYIFSGGSLYDRRLHAAVWRYVVNLENLIPLSDGRFLLADIKGVRLVELPEVDPDGSRFGSLVQDRLRVVRAGQTIRLDLSELVANGVPEVDAIAKVWAARLGSYGMKVQSGGRSDRVVKFEVKEMRLKTSNVVIRPLTRFAVAMGGRTLLAYRKQTPIRRSSDPFDRSFIDDLKRSSPSIERVKYRPTMGRIKLLADDEVAWQSVFTFQPSPKRPMLLEKNDKIQDHIDRECLPNPLLFATRFVPVDLCVVPEDLVGESTISIDGID